jgi:hypothetical protein
VLQRRNRGFSGIFAKIRRQRRRTGYETGGEDSTPDRLAAMPHFWVRCIRPLCQGKAFERWLVKAALDGRVFGIDNAMSDRWGA